MTPLRSSGSHSGAHTNSSALVPIIVGLARPREAIEGAFLAIGENLSDCQVQTAELIKTSSLLAKIADDPAVAEAGLALETIAAQASSVVSETDREFNELTALSLSMTKAERPIDDLRRTVRMIGILAINARVAVAAIGSATGAADVFNGDIARLSTSVATTVQRFHVTYLELSRLVGKSMAHGSNASDHTRTTLLRLSGSVVSALAELAQSRRQAAAKAVGVASLTAEIEGAIGQSMMSLQIGDAARQRLEHVEAALAGIAEIERSGRPAAAVTECVNAALTVQIAQLGGLSADFGSELVAAKLAMDELEALCSRLVQADMSALSGEGDGRTSTLRLLSEDVAGIVAAIDGTLADRLRSDHFALEVTRALDELSAHADDIRSIEADMRLVSLNAAIRCAQLGPQGRALDVIAGQLRAVTGETLVSINAILAHLNTARNVVAALRLIGGAGLAGRLETARKVAAGAVLSLERADDEIAAGLDAQMRRARQVTAIVRSSGRIFARLDLVSEQVSDGAIELADVAGHGLGAKAIGEAGREHLAGLRRQYTMSAERSIHDHEVAAMAADVETPFPHMEAVDAAVFF